MKMFFAPTRLLFSIIGLHARFYWVIGLAILSGMVGIVADSNWRTPILSLLVASTVYMLLAILRSVAEDFAQIEDELGRIGTGDLSIATDSSKAYADDGVLNQAVLRTRESLAQIVTQVRDTSDVIVRSTEHLGRGNQRLSERTEYQASTLEQAAAGMEELSVTVAQNADNASNASQHANDARIIAQSGAQDVNQLIQTVALIADSSRRVTDIIGVIEGIAFQTNILALNAAVEAARAGEQGRGFAVVVSEVRSLAQRSSEAVKESRTLIADVAERVDAGTALAQRAQGSIANVTQGIDAVAMLTREVSDASAQQRDGVEQMKQALIQLETVTQQNAELVNEANYTATTLNQEAIKLESALAAFHLDRQDDRAQAVALVKRAVAHIKSKGHKHALREIGDPNGSFVNGEFYIAVNDTKGICLAHGVKPEMAGQSHLDLQDADGKLFVREYLKIGANQGRGWVDFRWLNPATQRIQPKSGYVERVGDFIVSCGIYKNTQNDVASPKPIRLPVDSRRQPVLSMRK